MVSNYSNNAARMDQDDSPSSLQHLNEDWMAKAKVSTEDVTNTDEQD